LKCKKKIVSVTFLIFDHHSKCRICCNNLSSGLVFIYHPDLIAFIFNYTKKKSKKTIKILKHGQYSYTFYSFIGHINFDNRRKQKIHGIKK